LFRKLRGQVAEPLSYTARKQTSVVGKEKIVYVTDPNEVDKEIMRGWSSDV